MINERPRETLNAPDYREFSTAKLELGALVEKEPDLFRAGFEWLPQFAKFDATNRTIRASQDSLSALRSQVG